MVLPLSPRAARRNSEAKPRDGRLEERVVLLLPMV
jgi:hypothetical protein